MSDKHEDDSQESDSDSDNEPTTPKKPAGLPNIAIPKNFVKIAVDTTTQFVRDKAQNVVFIDVRDQDYTGGHIPGSVAAPYGTEFESKLTDLVKQYHSYANVIFYCMYGQLRSPSCALTFLKKQQELFPASPTNNVFVLSGGFHDYLVANHDDSVVVEGYDAACYTQPEFLHIRDADVKTFRPGK